MTVASPLSSGVQGERRRGTYPASRAFEDKSTFLFTVPPCGLFPNSNACAVPIYDGRRRAGRAFSFTDKDFQDLSDFPLFKNGSQDLPANAVVAVGYTLSTYVAERSGLTVLSSNIQFAILLGLTGAALDKA